MVIDAAEFPLLEIALEPTRPVIGARPAQEAAQRGERRAQDIPLSRLPSHAFLSPVEHHTSL
jgi:hypothetical protein